MAIRRMRLGEKWNEFTRLILPKDCSAIQRQEMRRVFYAGAEATLHVILRDLTPGGDVEAADLKMMDDLQAELTDFGEAVKKGTA